MSIKLFYFIVFASLNLTKSELSHSKYKYIGDCEWTNRGNNDSLTFICYDHYHEDRFFNYDDHRKPCLNDKQGYKKDSIVDVAFQNCRFSTITVDIIEYYRYVWRLDISDIGLTSLEQTNFNGNHGQRLRTLLASRNHLTEIKSNLFATAKFVKEVDFSLNEINRIDPLAFNDAGELQILDLSSNYLLKLESNVFEGLKNMSTLYLHNNKIDEIDVLAFSGATNLNIVELSFNNMTKVDARSFEGIPLTYLNLSHNTISEVTLKGLNDLQIFDLSYNHMTNMSESTFGNSSTIKMLLISHNRITNINDIGVLSDLIGFDASHNAITNVNNKALKNLVSITVLNLASNPIKMLNSDIFSMNTNLRHLNLSHTNLVFIESGAFLKPHRLESIDLSGNNFERFDFNVFLPRLDELRSFFLDDNELIDLNGFRRSLFPDLRVFGIQNNAFNCSYLRSFFESIVWHELSIHLNRTENVNSVNVGGIRCNANNNETELATTISMEVSSETTMTTNELTTFVVTEIPHKHNGNDINGTVSKDRGNGNLEVLLFVLCVIVSAFFILHVILHKDRFLEQIGYPRRRQINFQSTTTLNTEATVAFAAQLNSSNS